MTPPVRAALAMAPGVAAKIFPASERARLAPEVELLVSPPLEAFDSAQARAVLADVEVLITSWGCAEIDEEVLDAAPALRAIVHAGGSVKQHLTDAVWRRGIVVSSATTANAVPVAEYTLAMILLANKRVLDSSRLLTRTHRFDLDADLEADTGNYGKRVGLVGASTIGRRVIELLRPFDLEIEVADPFLTAAEAVALGVKRSELDELIASSDVISLHAPALSQTHHLIDRRRIGLIKPGATLINTARGSLVDQRALTDRLATGDIYAILDVTDPWIPAPGDRLYDLPNVFLTPHIAGSLGTELQRLAATAIAEAKRIGACLPPRHPIVIDDLTRIA
ncbi:hydroxyacid dehydrogenase [Microbacterium sulfonylureivorans]|uniref:hydroxyacid dehydrogenase n=1 Tax=Microbacterium sulfonylureivorans TaxID=2486854 RepID=UPI001F0C9223|nr:hydroxyacid dehydrogenase [Microbacterium sulfonylureivorans]